MMVMVKTISESMNSCWLFLYKYHNKGGGDTELPVTCYFQFVVTATLYSNQ